MYPCFSSNRSTVSWTYTLLSLKNKAFTSNYIFQNLCVFWTSLRFKKVTKNYTLMLRSSKGGMSGARLQHRASQKPLCPCWYFLWLGPGTGGDIPEQRHLSLPVWIYTSLKETFPAWADPLPHSTNVQNIFLRSILFLLSQTAKVSQSINLFGMFRGEYWATYIMTFKNKTKKLATKHLSNLALVHYFHIHSHGGLSSWHMWHGF